MKLLLVTMYFPPSGGGGVQRPLKFASHLPALGIETHVLAPDDSKWIHSDAELPLPTQAWVHRARYVGPGGRRPADEQYGKSGLDLALRRASTIGRRLLVPDENVTWNATAIPKAISIARSEGIDVVLTTSPPGSVHLIGAAVKKATGAAWVADLRDSHRAAPAPRDRGRRGVREGEGARRDRAARCAAGRRDRHGSRCDHRGDACARAEGTRGDDRERLRLRRLRRARVHADRPPPPHARGIVLRQARPEAVPAGARRFRAREHHRPVRRRLQAGRPRVPREPRPRRSRRDRRLRAAAHVARDAAGVATRCCS